MFDIVRSLKKLSIEDNSETCNFVIDIVRNIILTDIVKSGNQTKKWRNTQEWYINGKHNECEIFQQEQVNIIVSREIKWNTNIRIYMPSVEMKRKKKVLELDDGLEYTEDFDGFFTYNNIPFYLNLKMIIDRGGAQTRSVREVYHFVQAQIKYLLKNKKVVFFLNILDGDECSKNKNKFKYLLNKYKDYEKIQVEKYVFVGDMYEFKDWYKDLDTKLVFVNKMVSDIINQIE